MHSVRARGAEVPGRAPILVGKEDEVATNCGGQTIGLGSRLRRDDDDTCAPRIELTLQLSKLCEPRLSVAVRIPHDDGPGAENIVEGDSPTSDVGEGKIRRTMPDDD